MAIVHHKVTGMLTLFILDQIRDEDHQLDEVNLSGTVTWTPVLPKGLSQAKATGPNRLVSLKPIKSLVADGQIVSLSGTVSEIGDVPGEAGQELPVMIDDTPVWWQCAFDVKYESTPVIIPSMLVDATEGDVDITTLVSAGGFPDVDTSDIEAVIASARQASREAEAAFAMATAMAEEVAASESSAADSARDAAAAATSASEKAQEASDDATRAETAADRVGSAEAVLDAAKRVEEAATSATTAAGTAGDAAVRAETAATDAEGVATAAATTAATAAVAHVVGTAPENLDTLGEIADKLADQDDVAAALTTQIAGKLDRSTSPGRVYGTGLQGQQGMYRIASGTDLANSLLQRDENGRARGIKIAPSFDDEAASKGYVDTAVSGVVATASDAASVAAAAQAAASAALPASKIQVVTAMPATPVVGTVYYIVPGV